MPQSRLLPIVARDAESTGWRERLVMAMPVWERGENKEGMLGRSDFAYDAETDCYTCPNGKQLLKSLRNYKASRPIPKNGFINYRASKHDCMACPLKERCGPTAPARKLLRSVHESARDVAREVRKTPAYRKTRRRRKQVEMLFAHMKRILKVDRLRLRRLSGASISLFDHGDGWFDGHNETVAGLVGTSPSPKAFHYRFPGDSVLPYLSKQDFPSQGG